MKNCIWLKPQHVAQVVEPRFRAFKTEKADPRSQEEHYFGLWEQAHRSLVLAKEEWLIAYGNASAHADLQQRIHQWVELGMPSAVSFALQVFPREAPLTTRKNQWLVQRKEFQFLWSVAGKD